MAKSKNIKDKFMICFFFFLLAIYNIYISPNNNKNNIHVPEPCFFKISLNLMITTWIEALSDTESITDSVSLHQVITFVTH